MNPKLLLCLAVVLSGGLLGCSETEETPGSQVGDTVPLHGMLAKLNARVPELSPANFSQTRLYGDNSVTAYYTDSSGSRLTIIAKSYDSAAAANAGQEMDRTMIQAGGWNKTETIQGVKVYEFTGYGTMYFQISRYTWNLTTIPHGNDNMQPLLLKVCSALIADLMPPAEQP